MFIMLIPDQPLVRNHLYLITGYHAVFALTPLLRGGARGQNLGHLRIIFFFLYEIICI